MITIVAIRTFKIVYELVFFLFIPRYTVVSHLNIKTIIIIEGKEEEGNE